VQLPERVKELGDHHELVAREEYHQLRVDNVAVQVGDVVDAGDGEIAPLHLYVSPGRGVPEKPVELGAAEVGRGCARGQGGS